MTHPFITGFAAKTPSIIKTFLIVLISASIFVALTDYPLSFWLNWGSPYYFFSLSWRGLSEWYLWQPLTFLFVENGAAGGINVSFLLQLFLDSYIIWLIGSFIVEKYGEKEFAKFVAFSVGLSAFFCLFSMVLFNSYFYLAGPSALALSLITVWAMLYPEEDMLFYFLFPLKTKWVLAIVTAIIVLTTFYSIPFLIYLLSGIFFGYVYAYLFWGLANPYRKLRFLDRFLSKFKRKDKNKLKSKIVDFKSGQPLEDEDAFVDRMLEKISKGGEDALTLEEKIKLRRISNKRKQ